MAIWGTSATSADDTARWWVELVRERPLPTSVAKQRAETEKLRIEKEEAEKKAEEEEAKDAGKEEEEGVGEPEEEAPAKPPVKERVKAMLDKLPALPDAADAKPEDAADEAEETPEPTDEPEEAKPEEEAAEEAPEEKAAEATPDEPETLLLTVAMAGDIVSLDQKKLVFRPTYDTSKELSFPLKEITSLSRYAPGRKPKSEETPDLEFRVVLRDGSEIPGELVALTEKAITVSLERRSIFPSAKLPASSATNPPAKLSIAHCSKPPTDTSPHLLPAR